MTSVEVTSPIDTVMAVGLSTQLSAVASDAEGNALPGVAFTWSSSRDAVATVSSAGLVQGAGEGRTTLSAVAGGITGTLDMQVLAADVATIAALLADPYTTVLTTGLTDDLRGQLQQSLGDCDGAAAVGHLLALNVCLASIADGEATASVGTDLVLVAVLALVARRADNLLNL